MNLFRAKAPSRIVSMSYLRIMGFPNVRDILYLIESGADIDDMYVGQFWPGKLIVELKKETVIWGILSNGSVWRLYSTKSSRPFEDYVELSLA